MTETPAPQLPDEPDPLPDEGDEGDDRAVEDDTADRWGPRSSAPDLTRRRAAVEELLRGGDRWRS